MQFRKSPPAKTEKRIRVGCPAHNWGGRCLLIAHISNGRIIRLETDDRPDTIAAPQLRACVRGRAYLRRQYHPDRLTQPLKRTGARGEGKFRPISWEEALDTLSAQMERIKSQYGPSALFVPYGTGSYNQLNGSHVARRLMNLYGGCLGIYNSYSWGATNLATPTVYGTLVTGNQRVEYAARTFKHLPGASDDTAPQEQPPVGRLVLSLKGAVVTEAFLVPGRCVIGRTSDNDLQVESKYVSRHHAQIVTTVDGSWIEDLNSTNGIFVRGKRVRRYRLAEGDVVRLGLHDLAYYRADARATSR